MKRTNYESPAAEELAVAMEECILSGNGRTVVFGQGDYAGMDPDESDEGAY